MSVAPFNSEFLSRFDGVAAHMRKLQVRRGIAWVVCVLLMALALQVAADLLFELPRTVRSFSLLTLLVGAAAGLVAVVWRIHRRWSRPRTAAELEQRFPELGQRVRTTIECGGQPLDVLNARGVAPTLVVALGADTGARTAPLAFSTILPVRALRLAIIAALTIAVAMVLAALINWEWRHALVRSLFVDRPWTTVAVTPNVPAVMLGGTLNLDLDVAGRTNRPLTLFTRQADKPDAPWVERRFDIQEGESTGTRTLRYRATFTKLKQPLEVYALAGTVRSEVITVGIKYPLSIQRVQAQVTSPEYTGLPVKNYEEGSFTVLEGSRVALKIELDRTPHIAALVKKGGSAQEPDERIPLSTSGPTLEFSQPLTRDMAWSIEASLADGTKLPNNSFRIRVRPDEPPQVSFESPDENLEVHTLAEVPMRIRLSDDIGLARSGIVFQINNEREFQLLQEDFEDLTEAAQNVEAALKEAGEGKSINLPPKTRAVLGRLLPLESLILTQKDCITYYAFAEDNFPETPHRTETDLRFVDIRPFKTLYRLIEPMEPGDPMDGVKLVSLDEIIRRQRYTINRTIQFQKRQGRSAEKELSTIDRLVELENKLAKNTRDLANFFTARELDGAEVLLQAEQSMLAAVDSLLLSKSEIAVGQEKDAQQFLVEAREKLEIAILKSNRQTQIAAQQFDRRLAQKIRRPRDEDEIQKAMQIVDQLRKLANEEEQIGSQLAANQGGDGKSGKGGKPGETPKGAAGESAETPEPKPAGESTENPTAGQPPAEGDQPAPGPEGDKDSTAAPERTLPERQADVALEAAELRQALNGVDGITELAKSRMQAAAKQADEAAGALARGENEAAEKLLGEAARQFDELANQVAGLTAAEASQQVAMARSMAQQLAEDEQELANQMAQSKSPPGEGQGEAEKPEESQSGGSSSEGTAKSGGTSTSESPEKLENEKGGGGKNDRPQDPEQAALAGQSQQLVERAKTLEDVLKSIAKSDNPDSGKAAERVSQVLTEREVAALIKRLEAQAAKGDSGEKPDAEMQAEARDIGERLDITARDLDRIYRSLVMPRLARIKELEETAQKLKEELAALETESSIGEWHGDADQLLDELEKSGLGSKARDELEKTVKAGRGTGGGFKAWGWSQAGRFFVAPQAYNSAITSLTEELQRQIQELVLIDLKSARDEQVPPEYRRLVEQYLKVLSSDRTGAPPKP